MSVFLFDCKLNWNATYPVERRVAVRAKTLRSAWRMAAQQFAQQVEHHGNQKDMSLFFVGEYQLKGEK